MSFSPPRGSTTYPRAGHAKHFFFLHFLFFPMICILLTSQFEPNKRKDGCHSAESPAVSMPNSIFLFSGAGTCDWRGGWDALWEAAVPRKQAKPLALRNYCMHQVQVNQSKFRSICTVKKAQSGIDEIQVVAWRVIHRGICAVQLHLVRPGFWPWESFRFIWCGLVETTPKGPHQ